MGCTQRHTLAALAGGLPRVGLVWVLPLPSPGDLELRPCTPTSPPHPCSGDSSEPCVCQDVCLRSVGAAPAGAQHPTSGEVLWEQPGLGLWFPPFCHPQALGGLGGSSGLDGVSERGGERERACVSKGLIRGGAWKSFFRMQWPLSCLCQCCLLICAVRSGLGFGQGPGNW